MTRVFHKDNIFSGNYFAQLINYELVCMHRHDFIEFFYVMSGSCSHILNGTENAITAGDAFLIMPNDEHIFLNPSTNTDFMHRDILFSLDYFSQVCDNISPQLYSLLNKKDIQTSFHISSENISHIELYVSNISVANDDGLKEMLKKSLLSYILNLININSMKLINTPSWIRSLTANLCNPISFSKTLSEITSTSKYDKSYLCREFKKHIGATMSEYYNKQKLVYAKSLLATTDLSIEKICVLCGINSTSYFHRIFKKEFKESPNALRNK